MTEYHADCRRNKAERPGERTWADALFYIVRQTGNDVRVFQGRMDAMERRLDEIELRMAQVESIARATETNRRELQAQGKTLDQIASALEKLTAGHSLLEQKTRGAVAAGRVAHWIAKAVDWLVGRFLWLAGGVAATWAAVAAFGEMRDYFHW